VKHHAHQWWHSPDKEWVDGVGAMPTFVCTVCGEKFIWLVPVAQEYLVTMQRQGLDPWA
jgi:hypothetical protein